MSYVEPTAAVLLTLSRERDTRRVPNAETLDQRAYELLKQWQRADGGWGIAALDDESGWMTAWAVWALAGRDSQASARGVAWLLEHAGIRITDPAAVARIRSLVGIDATITGWPWQPGDAAWIFPTGLALLALHECGYDDHPRVREGIRYLLDRALPTGGWNIGNPFMLSKPLAATVSSTVIALEALTRLGVRNEVTARAEAWLMAQLARRCTTQELAWMAWWQAARGESDPRVVEPLRARQRADGSWEGNPFTTALVLMAEVGW